MTLRSGLSAWSTRWPRPCPATRAYGDADCRSRSLEGGRRRVVPLRDAEEFDGVIVTAPACGRRCCSRRRIRNWRARSADQGREQRGRHARLRQAQIARPLDGFGFVVPRIENRRSWREFSQREVCRPRTAGMDAHARLSRRSSAAGDDRPERRGTDGDCPAGAGRPDRRPGRAARDACGAVAGGDAAVSRGAPADRRCDRSARGICTAGWNWPAPRTVASAFRSASARAARRRSDSAALICVKFPPRQPATRRSFHSPGQVRATGLDLAADEATGPQRLACDRGRAPCRRRFGQGPRPRR